jgi:16S rRNA (cytosine1402-N4)-methyltransferase
LNDGESNSYDDTRYTTPDSRVPNRESRAGHQPALLREAIEYLQVKPDGQYIDATLGAGGHAEALLERLETGRLLGIDRDPAALKLAGERLERFGARLIMLHGNFAELEALHATGGQPPVNGVLADLGVSSMQLDDASRGFSFMWPGPLDMRMDPSALETAEEIVNHLPERDLADLIFKLGEERHSRRIARAIVKGRPYRTTTELAQVVTRAIPSRAALHHLHPATRTFLALRLAVNAELENLRAFLAAALGVVQPGGRVVVLSYHSLEDRMVKQAFQAWQRDGRARIVTKKVIRPSAEEVQANPRARSARLRVAEKIRD